MSVVALCLRTLQKFHKKNYFVKIAKYNKPIGTGNILNTNKCEISVCSSRYKNKYIIFASIDNLVKGASGQAIQNMNLVYGLNESKGLR